MNVGHLSVSVSNPVNKVSDTLLFMQPSSLLLFVFDCVDSA